MNIKFSEKIIYWRGPAPWYFVPTTDEATGEIKQVASIVTYGWGVIPVVAKIGQTEWETSLFPKDGRYLVPIKANIRKAEKLEEGDQVDVQLSISI